jgi:hypothetical protein
MKRMCWTKDSRNAIGHLLRVYTKEEWWRVYNDVCMYVQGGSNMTGTNCDLFTHNQSRSYLNHLVYMYVYTCWANYNLCASRFIIINIIISFKFNFYYLLLQQSVENFSNRAKLSFARRKGILGE